MELKKGNVVFTRGNCFRFSNKSTNQWDVSDSGYYENTSVSFKSPLAEDERYKSKGDSQQDEPGEPLNSMTSSSLPRVITSRSICHVQNKQDEERSCDCLQQNSAMNEVCHTSFQELDKYENILSSKSVKIIVKHNKVRHELCIPTAENGNAILQAISDCVSIPVSKLKLVHKGKMVTADNIQGMLFNRVLFLAFGEISENEEGLEKEEIDLIVKQLSVDRNLAVRVLRKTGNVVDAIIETGNM